MLVLPYPTSEFENNEDSFYNYYDEIEICEESARAHFKGAMQFRNRHMVDRADLSFAILSIMKVAHIRQYSTLKSRIRRLST